MISILAIGGTAALIWALSKVAKTSRFYNRLNVEARGRLHKLTFNKMQVAVKCKLKNPTNTSIEIQYPYVELYYKGEMLGSSQVVDDTIPIPQYGQPEREVLIDIYLLQLSVVAADIFRILQTQQGTLAVQGKVYTSLVTGKDKKGRVEIPPYDFTITL
jgi:hypothetical protein